MFRLRLISIIILFFITILIFLAIQSSYQKEAREKLLPHINIYNWSDYIALDTLEAIKAQTGVKIIYDVYDSNDVLEAKMLAGSSGYDLVVPTATPFLARGAKIGLYQKLDLTQFPELQNFDPIITKIMKQSNAYEYGIPWMWGTVGIGYNKAEAVKRLGGVDRINTLATIFNPKILAKFADCGVAILDSPADIIPAALLYAGLDPNSSDIADLKKVAKIFHAIRPFIRQFHSSKYINDLAGGNLCLVLGFSGDVIQARNRAKETSEIQIEYAIPKEGTEIWVDGFAIPADATNRDMAYKFINLAIEPKNIAHNSNLLGYANASLAARKFLNPKILNDPAIYPPKKIMKKLYAIKEPSREFSAARTRLWTQILSNSLE